MLIKASPDGEASQVSESGEILAWEAVPSIIKSNAALTYDESDDAIETPEHQWHDMLSSLHQAAQAIRIRREEAGAINLDRPEMLIKASLGIHITDAGALIPKGSVLDQEANRRMATLYMPERKVPMLPLDVSNAKGSLEPEETRATLSLMVQVSESGEILDWEAVPSIIKSNAALSYDESDHAIETPEHQWHDMLSSLHRVAQAIRIRREEAGAINLDRPEMLIKASPDGEASVRAVPRTTPARQMVTELMVLCNSLLAEFCRREDIPASYRSQTAPDPTTNQTMP